MSALPQAYNAIRDWAKLHGIHTEEIPLPAGKMGEFDGLRVKISTKCNEEERVYYLAHALGSIVRWCLDIEYVQNMFHDLRSAKENKNPRDLETAIARYRAFETETSQFAVELLEELHFSGLVGPYTNFMRADLEAMTQFHRTGRAPVWKDFFERWNDAVTHGRQEIVPFHPKPIPPFHQKQFETQDILQQQT